MSGNALISSRLALGGDAVLRHHDQPRHFQGRSSTGISERQGRRE
jgi:hypothetical protein